jgi:two-component system, sensor histidine kinase PdtaS
MIKRLIALIGLCCVISFTFGQQGFTRRDVDSILRAIDKSKADLHRMDLLLNLAQFHIFKPGENQLDFDSANIYINKAAALNTELKSTDGAGYLLLTQSFMTREKGQKDEAKKMVEKAISLLEAGTNKSYLGRAYYTLSEYYEWYPNTDLEIKIPLVEKSVAAFQQSGEMERKAFSLKMLGDLLNIHDENEKAIEVLKRSLAVYDSIHYPYLQEVYGLIGRNYIALGNHRQALQYELMALKTAEAVKDSSMGLCEIFNNLAMLYKNLEQNEQSINYAKAALQVAEKHDESHIIIMLRATIAAASTSKPGDQIKFLESVPEKYLRPANADDSVMLVLPWIRAYHENNLLEKAQYYCDQLLNILSKGNVDETLQSNAYRIVAVHYMKLKNYTAARKYLSKNIPLARSIGAYKESTDLMYWYQIDSAQGRYKDAFNHLIRYKTISDSIFNATKTKQFQQLEIEYETGKKQDSIKLMDKDISFLTQKNNLQRANLKQANLIRNVTIALVVLALLSIILLYRQYRHKQKSSNLISRKNGQLQHLLTEKEWLLKEIHHRVKNNLQIVMSLLNSQSAYINNEPALTAIHDSQHRVHAMSLIHQKLYNSENLSSIDMSLYIREMVSYLGESFNTGQRIRFEFAIAPLEVDVSQAVPLGLILNEAITNSIKYAFPDGRTGTISISLSNMSPNQYLLVISDNGVGMSQQFSNKKPGSLGMSLMEGLSEDLDGKFSIENNNGTTIKVLFSYDVNARRQDVFAGPLVSNN